jgi:hypothetical protein
MLNYPSLFSYAHDNYAKEEEILVDLHYCLCLSAILCYM